MNSWNTKRKLLIDSLLACTFLALVIFAIVYLFVFNTSSKEMADAASEKSVTLKTDDPFVQTVHIQNNTDKGNYSIQYPKTTSKNLNEAVKESITTAKKDFLATHTQSSTLVVDYKFVTHKKLYSFVLLAKVKQGSIFKEQKTYTFIVNSKNKELMALSDIIPNPEKLISILPLIHRNFAELDAVKLYNSQHKKKLALHAAPIHYQQIALSNKNLYFYFNNEQYNKNFDKTTRVAIPLTDIQSSLSTAYKVPVTKKIIKHTNKAEKNITPKKETQSERKEAKNSIEKVQEKTVKMEKKSKVVTIPTKAVALTFDDGPNPKSTLIILDILKKENIKATFFVLGSQAKKYPKIIKRIHDDGHEIGNHSYSHPNLTKLSAKQLATEIDKTNRSIKAATGKNPTVFRPPYGAYNKKVTKAAKLPNVLWTVDTLDWKNHNTKKIIANINAQKGQYSTILMHDIHMTSAKALPTVIKQLKKDHYVFVTSSEMIRIKKNSK